METSRNFAQQGNTYASYKHANSFKCLIAVTTASLLSINNALIEQTSPTRADNVVMPSVANAHVRTELCCKSRDTGLDITFLLFFRDSLFLK